MIWFCIFLIRLVLFLVDWSVFVVLLLLFCTLPPTGLCPGHSPSHQCHTLLLRRPNPCPIASVNGNSYPPTKVLPLHLPHPPPPLHLNAQSLPRFSSFGYVPLPISPPALSTPPLSSSPPLSTSQEQQSQTGTYCKSQISILFYGFWQSSPSVSVVLNAPVKVQFT